MRSLLIELKTPAMVLAVFSTVWMVARFDGDDPSLAHSGPILASFRGTDIEYPDTIAGDLAIHPEVVSLDCGR